MSVAVVDLAVLSVPYLEGEVSLEIGTLSLYFMALGLQKVPCAGS